MADFAAAIDEYYANPDVRARILDYCGATRSTPPTAAFLVALESAGPQTTWDAARHVPMSELDSLWDRRCDISRSLWDTEQLIVLLELDYENVDVAAEPFLHPGDALFKLETAYLSASAVFRSVHLPLEALATGRGYHFTGQIALDDPVVDALASIVPVTPAWYQDYEARRAPGVVAVMSERQARAWTGLGCVLEYAAHLIHQQSLGSPIPVVFNGTVVGSRSLAGRECVSIDFSHSGDPLDLRHVRTVFSTYQWHRLRPDIFGAYAASAVPPTAVLPRDGQSLTTMMLGGRTLEAAARRARVVRGPLPDVAEGIGRLLRRYTASELARFHQSYYDELRADGAAAPRALPLDVPPCISAPFERPNDLLLKPEHIQHAIRGLMARGWSPAQIAGLMQSKYEEDHDWGDRWRARMDAPTRAQFEARVFGGLIAIGADSLVDFNCVSAQEKDVCPRTGCPYDLRSDHEALLGRRT